MSTHTDNAPRTYTLTLISLLLLTFITVFAASFDFGSINVVIALAIATVKASLVGLIFMHLLHDKPVNAVIMVAGFVFLGLFLGFSFTDVSSRVTYDPINHRPPAGGPAAAAAEAAAKKAATTPAATTSAAPAPAAPAEPKH